MDPRGNFLLWPVWWFGSCEALGSMGPLTSWRTEVYELRSVLGSKPSSLVTHTVAVAESHNHHVSV